MGICKICNSTHLVISNLCHRCYERERYRNKHPNGATLCKCGCKEPIKNGNKFKHGHNRRGLVHSNSIRRGLNNNKWRGGKRTDVYGYNWLTKKDHPFCDSNGYVREHRLIYEDHHKCCLLPWILIHHINGIKNDNRIENLLPMTQQEHTKLHHSGKKKTKSVILPS
jgi:hypothetical protein